MATLAGIDIHQAVSELSINAIQPADELDAYEYEIIYECKKSNHFDSLTLSVLHWQMKHDDLFYLAKKFASIDSEDKQNHETKSENKSRSKRTMFQWYRNYGEFDLVLIVGPYNTKITIILYFVSENNESSYTKYILKADSNSVCKFGEELKEELLKTAPKWAQEKNTNYLFSPIM